MIRICLTCLLMFLSCLSANSAEKLRIQSELIDYFHIGSSDPAAGKLQFLGGLQLESVVEQFGGLSGLSVSENGSRLYTISDRSDWFTATIKRDANGKITGLQDAEISCLCRTNGTPYGSKHWGDSEALEIVGNTVYVAFERLNRINTYQLNQHQPGPPKQATASFKPQKIAYNKGLEAVALAPINSHLSGKLVAIAEESPNQAGNHRAFIADANRIESFSIKKTDDYAITDAAFLDNGDLLILERKFGISIGLGVRIRRLAGDLIKPGATLNGQLVMEAGITSRIDNMEGLAVWKNKAGETILSLVSDDNFSRIQRTLLLEFKLLD